MKRVIGYEDILKNGVVVKRAIYEDMGKRHITTNESQIPKSTLMGEAGIWRRGKER